MKNLRIHGKKPYQTLVLHGGPGAAGEMYPVAKFLSRYVGIVEPLQTKDSINGQIEELKEVIDKWASKPVVLIGWSWGAWLAFIFTFKYPKLVKKLILISSGPFEQKYVGQLMKTRLSHLSKIDSKRVKEILKILNDKSPANNDKVFKELGYVMDKSDSFFPVKTNDEKVIINQNIYREVWQEASLLRSSGKLLTMGKRIVCPVVIIHGDYDPHPWKGVVEPLQKVLGNVKSFILKKCGHHPWKEKFAKSEFYRILTGELIN